MKQFSNIRPLILFTCCIFCRANMNAQNADSLTPYRDFINISTAYKQIPLYLKLEMRNSTNFITRADDTADVQGEFYLRSENSYVRFGEFEEIVNDSLALLVSDKLKHMNVYAKAGGLLRKMNTMMGTVLPDSSIRNLARQYESSFTDLSSESSTIKLQSRVVLYGTNLPKATIELQYNLLKKIPEKVTTLKRSLLRLDSLQYSQLNETGAAEKLLILEGNYFLIKEQVTAYIYKEIEQESSAVKVPVLAKDRVIKNEEGIYMPVKNYESYSLTKNE